MDSGRRRTSAVSRNSVASELRASGVEAAAAAAAMAAASRASGGGSGGGGGGVWKIKKKLR
jgi:hypothetical protein